MEKKSKDVYCQNCGVRISHEDDFCPECGNKQKKEIKSQKKIKDPLTACLFNLLILGAGFWYLGKWGKGFLFLFLGIVTGAIFGYNGIGIAYIITMILSYQEAKKVNNGENVQTKNTLTKVVKIIALSVLILFCLMLILVFIRGVFQKLGTIGAEEFAEAELKPQEPQTKDSTLTQQSEVKNALTELYLKVGEPASDRKVRITINSIRYAKEIDELDNEFRTVRSSEGKKYLIADVTIENLQSKRLDLNMFRSELHSKQGYVSYEETGIQANFLANPFPYEGYILVNSKVKGEIPYEIFNDAEGLKIVYTYTDYEPSDLSGLYQWTVTFEIE